MTQTKTPHRHPHSRETVRGQPPPTRVTHFYLFIITTQPNCDVLFKYNKVTYFAKKKNFFLYQSLLKYFELSFHINVEKCFNCFFSSYPNEGV